MQASLHLMFDPSVDGKMFAGVLLADCHRQSPLTALQTFSNNNAVTYVRLLVLMQGITQMQ